MKTKQLLILIGVLFVLPISLIAQQHAIKVEGFSNDNMGLHLYNTYTFGTPTSVGYYLPMPYSNSDSIAYANISTPNSKNGIQQIMAKVKKEPFAITGFPNLKATLISLGLQDSMINIHFDYAKMSNNNYGSSWWLNGNIESRKYSSYYNYNQINLYIYYGGNMLGYVEFDDLKLEIDYNNVYDKNDDKYSLKSSWSNFNKNQSSNIPELANALSQDMEGFELRMNFHMLQFAGNFEENGTEGKVYKGKKFNIVNGLIEKSNFCGAKAMFNYKDVDFLGKKIQFDVLELPSSPYTIYWKYGDGTVSGNPSTTNRVFQHKYNNYGNYTVTMIIQNPTNPSCIDSIKKNIIVKPFIPKPSLLIHPSSMICNSFNIDGMPIIDSAHAGVPYKVKWRFNSSSNFIYNPQVFNVSQPASLYNHVFNQSGFNKIEFFAYKMIDSTIISYGVDSVWVNPPINVTDVQHGFPLNGNNVYKFTCNYVGGSEKLKFDWRITNFFIQDSLNIYSTDTSSIVIPLNGPTAVSRNIKVTVHDSKHYGCVSSANANFTMNNMDPNCGKFAFFTENTSCDIVNYQKSITVYSKNTGSSPHKVDIYWGDGQKDTLDITSYSVVNNSYLDHSYSQPGIYNILVETRDGVPCPQYSTYSKNVKAFSKVKAEINHFKLNDSVYVFKPQIKNGSGDFYYKWYVNTVLMSNKRDLYYKIDKSRLSLNLKFEVGENTNPMCSTEVYKSILIDNNIIQTCQAGFNYQLDNINKKKVYFLSFSTSTAQLNQDSLQLLWNFGDGNYSTLKNPIHVYTNAGKYRVCLSATDKLGGVDQQCIEILVGEPTNLCFAAYNYEVLNGTTVKFYNQTTGASIGTMQNVWNFGDGNVTMMHNPIHTFSKTGLYNVSLMIRNPLTGCNDFVKKIITVGDTNHDCDADFDYYSEINSNTVYFSNTSLGTNDATKYFWNFGDGTHSQLQNPIHQYATVGFKNVCLTIRDSIYNGYNTQCKIVKVGSDTTYCNADFEFVTNYQTKTVYFKDKTVGNPNNWLWNFGDNTTSTNSNPTHTYSLPGKYLVHLKAKNSFNSESHHFAIIHLDSAAVGLYGDFGYVLSNPVNSKAAGKVDFKGTSFGDVSKTTWNFGDGNLDSTQVNPEHEYAAFGTYNVCMKVEDPNINQSYTNCKQVNINTGINNIVNKKDDFIVYPNPSNGQINISFISNEDMNVKVFNILGSLVYEKKFNANNNGLQNIKLDLSNNDKGIYYIQLDNNTNVMTKKVIIN